MYGKDEGKIEEESVELTDKGPPEEKSLIAELRDQSRRRIGMEKDGKSEHESRLWERLKNSRK